MYTALWEPLQDNSPAIISGCFNGALNTALMLWFVSEMQIAFVH